MKAKNRITLEISPELLKKLENYAARHTDCNISAAVRRAIREAVAK